MANLSDLQVGMLVKHTKGFVGEIKEFRKGEILIEVHNGNGSGFEKGFEYWGLPQFVEIIGYHTKDGFTVGDKVQTYHFNHEGVITKIKNDGTVILKLTKPATSFGEAHKGSYSVHNGTAGLKKLEKLEVPEIPEVVNTNIDTLVSDSYEVEVELKDGIIIRMDYKHFNKFAKDILLNK